MARFSAAGAAFLVLSWFLSGCATMGDRFLQVKKGMSPLEVASLLGEPRDRHFGQDREEWFYTKSYLGQAPVEKVIVFEKGQVSEFKSNELVEARNFELKRAEAGATKIEIVNGAVSGIHPSCVDRNVFGFFAQGGGCNAFGCWPPGGSCNTFGCSARGQCSSFGCEAAIDSFECTRIAE